VDESAPGSVFFCALEPLASARLPEAARILTSRHGPCKHPTVLAASTSHLWFWQTPSWNWAELWALVVLLIVSLLPMRVVNPVGGGSTTAALFVALVNGRDGRWSTSKTSSVLWTYAVWFAFISILLHTNGKGLDNAVLKQQYLVLLGIPVGAAVAAKGFVQTKVDNGVLAGKTPAPPEKSLLKGLSQLVTNDAGAPDLLDLQYFGFNLILLAYFFTRFLGHQKFGLPELPDSLVALSGVTAAGYLGKKALERDPAPGH